MDQYFRLAFVQTYLDDFVNDCVEGVGGPKGLLGDIAGVGGHVGHRGMDSEGLGKAKGGIGGIGEEHDDQHGGKVWRFEGGGGRKRGIGVDASEEKLRTEGIDRSRSGGIDGLEDRMTLLGDCREI